MRESKTMIHDLTEGNLLQQMVRLSLPTMLANSLQVVYTIVDMMIIGRFVGTAGISAVSSAGDLMMFATAFSMGMCGAGQVMISQHLGRKQYEAINRTIGTMFCVMLSAAVLVMSIGLPLRKPLLRMINTPPEAWNGAVGYMTMSLAGMIFVFGYNAVSAMLRGMGDASHPLMFVLIASVINIVLDIVFIGVLQMGAFGAALATVTGQGAAFLFSLVYLFRHREAFGFDFKPRSFIPDLPTAKIMVKMGVPMAMQHMIANISVLYVSSLVNAYGVVYSSISGIGAKLRIVVATVTGSIGTAGSAIIGQNFSAGNHQRVRQVYRYSFVINLVVILILGGLCVIFPEAVIGLFDSNPDLMALAPQYMLTCFVTFMTFVLYQPGNSLINGIGYAAFAFLIGVADGLVARIGLVWLLGKVLDLGIWGIWWGAALAGVIGGSFSVAYYLSGKWKTFTPPVEKI